MSSPLVSVIVPTKNSGETLEACLKSITDQTYKNIELIVVDNNSTDNTKEIAKKFTDKVFNKGPERSAQRNYGAKKSEGKYLLFIDSDMVLTEKVVEEGVRKFQAEKEVLGLVIPEESFGEGFWAQCKKLERSFYVGVPWMEAARFYRVESFEKVGGYNEKMISAEDWDLSQRVGKISRTTALIRHNEGKLSLRADLKKKYFYATEFKNYTSASGNNSAHSSQTSLLKRYALLFSQPRQLVKRPHIALGMLFMKTSEFFVGSLGIMTKN